MINKEDYMEPRCPLCEAPYGAEADIKPVPQQRIRDKMDEYMAKRDYAGAERHLLYWLEEAKLGHDLRGQLMLRNELVGHYRKTGDRDKAISNGEEALRLVDVLDFGRTVSAGTTYVNYATACSAFGENEKALELFERARAVYEREMPPERGSTEAGAGENTAPGQADGEMEPSGAASPGAGTSPELLGGLYNNMALACAALGRYDEALELYGRATEQMTKVENGELEQAITCLNMADTLTARDGDAVQENEINALLDRAEALLDTPEIPRDGYYAFVCEKCAPSFEYYGYFLTAQSLKDRAEEIYLTELHE